MSSSIGLSSQKAFAAKFEMAVLGITAAKRLEAALAETTIEIKTS